MVKVPIPQRIRGIQGQYRDVAVPLVCPILQSVIDVPSASASAEKMDHQEVRLGSELTD